MAILGGTQRASVPARVPARAGGATQRAFRVGRPTETRPGERRDLLPLGIGAVLVIGVTGLWQQLGRPFISHDDWDFLLPVEPGRSSQMYHRLFWEGRLLNYLAWRGPGHLLTPFTATLAFELCFLAIVAGLAWRWAPGWLSVPTTVALFASPMITQVSFWPATLWFSMLLGAIAVLVLPRCAENDRDLAIWIVLATYLTFLSYPPMAWMLFVVVMVEMIDRRFRDLVLATVLFGATYVVGTLTIFGFNKVRFGKFGLDYQAWRDPNPLRSGGDLVENLHRSWVQLSDVLVQTGFPLILAALAIVGCLALPELRVRAGRWLLVAVVLLGLTSGSTVVAGVLNPYRSYGAVWLLVVPPVLWLSTELAARRVVRGAAMAGLAAICAWSAFFANHAYLDHEHRRASYQRDEDRVIDLVRLHRTDPVVLVGTDENWKSAYFNEEGLYLIGKLQNDHGLRVIPCIPSTCDLAHRQDVNTSIVLGVRVFHVDGLTVLVPSDNRR